MNYILSCLLVILLVGCQNEPIKDNIIVKYDKSKLAKKDKKIEKQLVDEVEIDSPLLAIESIAIVYASKTIGKYAIEATNTAMTHLISKKNNFELKVFGIENENYKSISEILNYLEKEEISKVIFMITSSNVKELFRCENIDYFNLYLPLVNNSLYDEYPVNIIFGGIDYQKQFKLLKDIATTNIVEIYDDSTLGEMLHNKLYNMENNISNTIQSLKLIGKNPNYSYFLRKNKIIKNSTIILNMPIIKSSILLSQIRANEIDVKNILTTQINYTPLLLVLTQKKDRKNLIIANIIERLPNKIEAINTLLGNDILHNWVNFSTILGIEYFINNQELLFDKININNNQIQYNINLLDASGFNFKIIN